MNEHGATTAHAAAVAAASEPAAAGGVVAAVGARAPLPSLSASAACAGSAAWAGEEEERDGSDPHEARRTCASGDNEAWAAIWARQAEGGLRTLHRGWGDPYVPNFVSGNLRGAIQISPGAICNQGAK